MLKHNDLLLKKVIGSFAKKSKIVQFVVTLISFNSLKCGFY